MSGWLPEVQRQMAAQNRKEENIMLRAMDSAVSGLRAHQNKLDVIGNNIANVNTFGFQSQSYSFKEAMYQTSTASTGGTTNAAGTNAAQYGYGSMMGTISTDMTSSTPTYVGGLNACINGQGFFITSALPTIKIEIDTDATKVADNTKKLKENDYSYTRVGQFQIDSNGYLTDGANFVYGFQNNQDGTYSKELVALRVPKEVTKDGKYTYCGDGDTAAQASSVQINELGEVTAMIKDQDGNAHSVSLGKVAIATFQNQEGLTKSGGHYYTASTSDNTGLCSATIPGGSTSKLMSGYLEASNVDLAKEFTEMITTQRGFQANSKIITVSDEILSELINMKR